MEEEPDVTFGEVSRREGTFFLIPAMGDLNNTYLIGCGALFLMVQYFREYIYIYYQQAT